MKKDNPNPLWYNVSARKQLPPKERGLSMQNIIPVKCPKCNSQKLHKFGKTKCKGRYQKYRCRVFGCRHQFAPELAKKQTDGGNCRRKYPPCPKCNKASFLHHDYDYYFNYRCCDKKCNHSFFVCKPTVVQAPSMTKLFGKEDFKRMRHPSHLILTALTMFFLGKSSYRNISLVFRLMFGVKVSHTTIGNWCTRFAPMFDNIRIELMPMVNLDSSVVLLCKTALRAPDFFRVPDEWHTDETVVKIAGQKHYIWFIIDSETRFIIGFHLSPSRGSDAAFSLLSEAFKVGKPKAIVSDQYTAYKVPVKAIFGDATHIRVKSFKDLISNNLIESFHKQFKAWYKTKQGFASYAHANNLIATYIFFFNFVRPHLAFGGLTPSRVAGVKLSDKQKRKLLLVA